VRGNNDQGAWADGLREVEELRVDRVSILLLHDIADLKRTGRPPRARVVVTGHSHKPLLHEAEGVLYLNPGSAGPRRFKLPVSVAELTVSGSAVTARLVELFPAPASR
jgi:predicted phosphodiesterase